MVRNRLWAQNIFVCTLQQNRTGFTPNGGGTTIRVRWTVSCFPRSVTHMYESCPKVCFSASSSPDVMLIDHCACDPRHSRQCGCWCLSFVWRCGLLRCDTCGGRVSLHSKGVVALCTLTRSFVFCELLVDIACILYCS